MSHELDPRLTINYGFDEEHALPFWEMSDGEFERLLIHLQNKISPAKIKGHNGESFRSEPEYVDDLDLMVGTAAAELVSVGLDAGDGISIVAQLKRMSDFQAQFLLWFENEDGEVVSHGLMIPASSIHLLKRAFLYPSGRARNFVTVGKLSASNDRDENDWELILPMLTESDLELFRFGITSIGIR